MQILESIHGFLANKLATSRFGLKLTNQANRELSWENDFLQESMSRLQLEIENIGYEQLNSRASRNEFTREGLRSIIELCVVMAIKNPLTNRSVNVQSDYVFGRGVRFVAKHPMVQQVVDECVDYVQNQKVLFSHHAMSRQEKEHLVKGNLFFVLFTNKRTGRVTVRDLDMTEVSDILRDPEDYHQEWFIKRVYTDDSGKSLVSYFPALGVTQDTPRVALPKTAEAGEIYWDAPCYHVGFNTFGRMKFAIPEIYPQVAYALAYKGYLENWSTIQSAFARMAMKVSGLGGKKQAAAAKGLLNTSVNLSAPLEGTPSPTAASTMLLGKGVNIEPVKTAGATSPASEGQPLKDMAATAAGLPSTFFGDASDGLDRPTELKMVARQLLWAFVFTKILEYAVQQSVMAPQGILAELGAKVEESVDPFNDAVVMRILMPNNEDLYHGAIGEPISTTVSVKFPELLERNVTDRVRALVNALTLFGKPLMDIIPDKRLVARLLLEALNVDGIDEMIPQFVDMWTKNMSAPDDGKPVDPVIVPPAPPQPEKGAEDPSQGGAVGANG